MPIVKVKENEPFEVALRRFKRAIEKTGLPQNFLQESFMKNLLLKENVKKLLLLKDTKRFKVHCCLINYTSF